MLLQLSERKPPHPKVKPFPLGSPQPVLDSQYKVPHSLFQFGVAVKGNSRSRTLHGIGFCTMVLFSFLCPILYLYFHFGSGSECFLRDLHTELSVSGCAVVGNHRRCNPYSDYSSKHISSDFIHLPIQRTKYLISVKLPLVFPFLFSYNKWESLY